MIPLMKLCSKCETEFPLEENICPHCGSTEFTVLITSNTMQEIRREKFRKKQMVKVLLVLFLIFVALVLYAIIRASIEGGL